jgi:hypothetical protein
MRLLILLGVLLLFNMTFELIDENAPQRDWWFFDRGEYQLTPEWYTKEITSRASYVISFFLLAYYVNHDRKEVLLYAWLQVFDFVDWILTNSTAWYHVWTIPISANMIIPTIFTLAFGYRIWKTTDLN